VGNTALKQQKTVKNAINEKMQGIGDDKNSCAQWH
jgi:hypothetical protein